MDFQAGSRGSRVGSYARDNLVLSLTILGHLRSTDQDFVDATRNYISRIGSIISKAQITNGGPVILFQPENEYTACVGTDLSSSNTSACLEGEYMATVESLYRDSGVEVPFVHNDAVPLGNWAPGTGAGAVDIYGFDTYPFGWGNPSCKQECSKPFSGLD